MEQQTATAHPSASRSRASREESDINKARHRVEQYALEQQNGVILGCHAFEAGLTRSQIDWSVQSRRWAPGITRGTFILQSRSKSPLAQLTSATLGIGGLAWGRSALALWDLTDFPPRPIVATSRQVRSQGMKSVRPLSLDRMPQCLKQQVPTVQLDYALASASPTFGMTALTAVVDEALRLGLTTWPRVERSFEDFAAGRHPGSKKLRDLIADRIADTAIPLSAWSREFCDKLVASGLPRPKLEWQVTSHDRRLLAQVDLAYPDQKYAIELDSITFHLNTEAFETDRRRDSDLFRVGWRVSRFTWRQYKRDWANVAATVKAGLQLA